MVDNQKTWDTIAKSFDKTRQKTWKECINYIDQLMPEGLNVDLACGNGRHLLPLANKSKKTIGIDISKKMLKIIQKKIIKQKINNISLIQANAEKIPIKKQTIDHLIFIAALHNIKHKKKRIQTLNEVKRILKTDGNALISVWSREQDRFRNHSFEKELENKENTEYGDITIYWKQDKLNIPRFYHLYSKNEFKEELAHSNLEIISFKESKIVSKKYPDNFFALVR
jgi:tRNA (uracil-5-)-methyltransferase TRM9